MTIPVLLQRAVPIALLCLLLSPPAMAQGVGAIGGTVQDTTGGALPGVAVSLSNPGVIGGNQQTFTDERGAYRFARLVPGSTYTVLAELSGFGTATGQQIVVNADVTTRLDLTLQLAGLAETLTVAGASPLVDTTSVFNQTVMDRQVLDALPSGRDLWTIARIVPGVLMNSYDVGGSSSFLQGSATVHGASLSENAYLVDGMDVAAPTTPGSTNSYFDTSMFEEVNYQTGNSSAESEFGGIVYNMVTKTGTNRFRGSYLFTGSNGAMNSNNITSELRTDLLAAIPARLLQAHPDIEPLAKILSFYDAEASLAGPLVRDRLWFTASGNVKGLDQLKVGSYNPDGTQFVNDNRQLNYGSKLSWQATQGHQINYVHQWSQRIAYHRVLDPLGFYESRAAAIQDVNSTLDIVNWMAVLSSRLVLDVSAHSYRSLSGMSPEPGVKPGDIPGYDVVTRRYTVAAASYTDGQPGLHSAHANLSYVVGSHDLKFGYQPQYRWSKDRTPAFSVSHEPSGLRANFRDGVPDSVNTYSTPVSSRVSTMDHGVFIQDKWRATRRLTLNLGVRLQNTNGSVPANCQVETIFVGAQCFSELKNVPNWLDLVPRIGMVYDIFGDGRTALKLAANRYTITEGTAHVSRVNPVAVKNDTRRWTDTNGDLIPQLNELGASTGFNLGTTNRYNPNLKRPYSNEFNVELERQLPGNSVVSVGYFRREQHRNIGSKNLLVPLEGYTPLVVTETVSGKQVTVYNQDPATRGKFDVLLDNFPELDRTFNGMDLTFNKRLSNRWMVISGLSVGRNIGDTYGVSGDLNNPNLTFRRGLYLNSGYTSWGDVPVSFKVSGMYELPYEIRLSGNAQHFTGFPEQDTVVVTASTVALTQVSQSLRIAPLGTNRLPSTTIVDLNARKSFKLGRQLTVEPVMEVFNLTNGNTITARSTQLGPTYGRVIAILSGRMWRFGFNVKF